MLIKQILIHDDSGSTLLMTLLVLVAVTILGVMSINTSKVELLIARNEREVRESFYLAEGAAMVGIQRLIGMGPRDLNQQSHDWHHSRTEVQAKRIDYRDINHWQTEDRDGNGIMTSPLDRDSFVTAVEWNVAPGSSLIQTQSRLYQNRVYGLCTKNNTDNLIELGYQMRY